MIKSRNIVYLTCLIFLLLTGMNTSLAVSKVEIFADKEVIKQNEETRIRMEMNNTNVAAFTLEIFWDNTKLEYISGPENSNYSEGRIIYAWASNTGLGEDNIAIGDFIFKGIDNGIASIVTTGVFYNSNGEPIDVENANFQMQVGEIQDLENVNLQPGKTQSNAETGQENNITDDNTNLSVLRLDREGISPEFNKDIKEYYFIADETITDLEVTAIPENSGSVVTITGNRNLKRGKNTINIGVQSKDKSKTSEYKIYVTKTDNLEKANANLETLAIRQGALNPEFNANITKYIVEVANDVDKIELLAIPQREKATVNILGNEEMKIGYNKIEIIVTAEDAITNKKYEVEVYRRNESEEAQNRENQIEAERVSTALLEQYSDSSVDKNSNKEKAEKVNLSVFIIGGIVILVLGVSAYIILYKMKRR